MKSPHFSPRGGAMTFIRFGTVLTSCAAILLGSSGANAATYTANAGGGNWGDAAIWTPVGGPPNSALDVAHIPNNGNLTLATAVGDDASFTIQALNVNNSISNTIFQNVAGGTGRLIFDNGVSNASLASNKTSSRITTINTSVQLNSDLDIFARNSVFININGSIVDGVNGSRGITLRGANNANPISTVTIGSTGTASTYTGMTTIQGSASSPQTNGGGKLRIGMSNALSASTVLSIGASNQASNAQGGRFDLNGFNQTVAGLSGDAGTAAGLVTNLTAGASTGTLTVDNSANFTFSGSIANGTNGIVALTKDGAGVQSLDGDNSYTGATTVNAGTLLVGVAGVGSLGNSAVTVNAGTLGGTGSAAGTVTVGDGAGGSDAFIAAGDGADAIGTFTMTNSLSLASDATFVFEYNGTVPAADQLVANGVAIDGLSVFSFADINPGTLTAGTEFVIINNTSGSAIAGTFSNLADGGTFTSGANQFQASYSGGTGNDLVLTVVPEPQTAMLMLGGFGVVAFLRRARRNR